MNKPAEQLERLEGQAQGLRRQLSDLEEQIRIHRIRASLEPQYRSHLLGEFLVNEALKPTGHRRSYGQVIELANDEYSVFIRDDVYPIHDLVNLALAGYPRPEFHYHDLGSARPKTSSYLEYALEYLPRILKDYHMMPWTRLLELFIFKLRRDTPESQKAYNDERRRLELETFTVVPLPWDHLLSYCPYCWPGDQDKSPHSGTDTFCSSFCSLCHGHGQIYARDSN